MDFEFIDESEVEYSARGGNRQKKEKIDSLFDKPRENRTYWGKELGVDGEYHDDLGTQLYMCLAQSAIRNAVRHYTLIDIDDHHLSARLNKEYRDELRKYQILVLEELIFSHFENVTFVVDSDLVTHIVIPD
jgi:hypothetical protein